MPAHTTDDTPVTSPTPDRSAAHASRYDGVLSPGENGGIAPLPEFPLADRLAAARELRAARELAEGILADAEHRAGLLVGRAELLWEEARAEREHVDRFSRLAGERAADMVDTARDEHERLLAVARMKAALIISSARSEAARLAREGGDTGDRLLVDLADQPSDAEA